MKHENYRNNLDVSVCHGTGSFHRRNVNVRERKRRLQGSVAWARNWEVRIMRQKLSYIHCTDTPYIPASDFCFSLIITRHKWHCFN